MIKLCLIFFILGSTPLLAKKAFYGSREEGWFWYKEDLRSFKKEKKEKIQVSSSPLKILTPKQILKKQGEELEKSLSTAILYPTRENITDYILRTRELHNQSERFAKKFQEAIWINPEFDRNLVKPVHTEATISHHEYSLQKERDLLKTIKEQYGLIFLFQGSCPVCHRFAPILKLFEQESGLKVIAVSADGKGLQQYPQFKRDFGFGSKVNVKVYPSVFMVHADLGEVYPVSYGFSSYSTLKQKVIAAFKRTNHE